MRLLVVGAIICLVILVSLSAAWAQAGGADAVETIGAPDAPAAQVQPGAPVQIAQRPERGAPEAKAAADGEKKDEKKDDKAEEKPEEPPLTLTITPAPKGWNLHAVNVDAHELLTSFAREAKLRLIVDDTVKRKLTIHILDKPAAEVIELIVDAYGLSSAQVDGIQIISEGMPKNPSSYLLSEIESVTTKYVAPAQAQKLLPVFLQGHVRVNTDRNAVVLSGPASVVEKFRQDIQQFDVPAQQVMLDVLVVEFTDLDADSFTATLGLSNANFGVQTDSLTGTLVLSAVAKLPTDFFANLSALVTNRKGRVRANPRVATISGRQASIFIGVQQYLSIPVNLRGSSNYIDAGVRLEMTPLTGGGGEIILDLDQEISTLSTPDAITGLPTKTTRSSTTTVRVQDGETVIIGGLRQQEQRATRRAIPILSQIPIIGRFFTSKSIERTDVDLAIFITARILSPTGHLPAEDEATIRDEFDLEAPMQ